MRKVPLVTTGQQPSHALLAEADALVGESHPIRIQRRRTKGWRMPEGAIYVGRPTEWGNPFTGPDAVPHFRLWMTGEFVPGEPGRQLRQGEMRHPNGMVALAPVDVVQMFLRGHDLACWCALDQPCHADVLLELANR